MNFLSCFLYRISRPNHLLLTHYHSIYNQITYNTVINISQYLNIHHKLHYIRLLSDLMRLIVLELFDLLDVQVRKLCRLYEFLHLLFIDMRLVMHHEYQRFMMYNIINPVRNKVFPINRLIISIDNH